MLTHARYRRPRPVSPPRHGQPVFGLESLEARAMLSAVEPGLADHALAASMTFARQRFVAALQAAPDDNDALSEVHPLALNNLALRVTQVGIDRTTDVDLYAVELRLGDKLTIDLDATAGSGLDSFVRLFNSTGRTLAQNDNGRAPGEARSRDSYLSFTASADGIYYVGVSSRGNQGYNPLNGIGDRFGRTTGEYELALRVTEQTPPTPNPTPTPTPAPTPEPTPAPAPADWFAEHLRDINLANLARSLLADGSLGRTDVIGLLRGSVADGTLGSNELTDLQTIVAAASTLSIAEPVAALAGYVVHGNVANAYSQGRAVGNLFAGSTADQMELLIGEWFFGLDHPTAQPYGGGSAYTYRQAAGQLFINGPSMTDIQQGNVGDCYFIAALGAIAQHDPADIRAMFTDNGDGTYTVRFFQNGTARYVTVDRMLPTYSWGGLAFAGSGASVTSPSTELWVALAEKAYAQLNEQGWIGHGQQNSYQALSGGWMEYVNEHVLGRNSTTTSRPSMNDIVSALNHHTPVTVGTRSSPGNGLVGGHAYIVCAYNAANQTFSVHNPWGYNHVTNLTWAQMQSSFMAFTFAG